MKMTFLSIHFMVQIYLSDTLLSQHRCGLFKNNVKLRQVYYETKKKREEKKKSTTSLLSLLWDTSLPCTFLFGGKSSICFTGSSLAINWPLRILFCPVSFHREWQMPVCPSPSPPPLLPPAWAFFPTPPTPSAPSFGCQAWKRAHSPGALEFS